jgi:hypothetical protein
VREPLLELEGEVRGFESDHEGSLGEIVSRGAQAEAAAAAAQEAAEAASARADEVATRLRTALASRLDELREWGLNDVTPDAEVDVALVAIDRAASAAAEALAGRSRPTLAAEEAALASALREIGVELQEIEEELAGVEAAVVGRAAVLATTLTRGYKRDSVQARRFDTVILDEASMAPIPALWVAAGLSEANIVVVGDPKQLPPIKHAEHPLAEKWLGEDVFRRSGVEAASDAGRPPDHLVQLRVQRRMRPEISAIPNALVYDGRLIDGPGVEEESELDAWYERGWGHDAPVLLVDMEPLNAWVTSVRTGRAGGSRLNFLSAMVSVDLAEQMLRLDRPELSHGSRARILIEAPYRPQFRLVNLLVREAGLEREVAPGTAHTSQGNEAPVVIFDLVLDEPHRRAGLFDAKRNDGYLRLLNVALTRARRRLIVLGDFKWIEQHANRQSSLQQLVGYLREHYPLVSAREVVRDGLQARAAAAHRLIAGGGETPEAQRLVITQEDFYPLLLRDLDGARERVVIYSPFMTPDRVASLEPNLRSAVERGVRVYLVTKTIGERSPGQRETSRQIEDALDRWGITVLHKFQMHEKLAFIDDEILWSGSLNSLSFSDTQEVMERRRSRTVASDYARVLRLDALLGAHEANEDRCPICGGELVAAESRLKGDPFYWRCLVPDCYSRSLDQAAPREGLLPCSNCGARVEFRQMPTGPHWRCTANPRHRQRVIPSHLRLPRMRELVPARDLARLEREFARENQQLRFT